ncbi:unnamed protein product [Prorocentrum cordatum]|uniref:Palmitoyltransferase n=1 Tax=Prorocentrum cordatum TaxID=2364126 RepID=A0ABN9WX17_9DINO|nr:unnamed protein product [Polarella glacialis]
MLLRNHGDVKCGLFFFGSPPFLRFWSPPTTVLPLACLLMVYVEAVAALVSLGGLLFCDPGTIRRSQDRCFPVPPAVAEKLRSGELAQEAKSRRPRDNIVEGDRTYCIRCLVWRDRGEDPACSSVGRCPGNICEGVGFHHCSTCQRCVEDFDHHCMVFGRCIAGRGFSGNMGFFKTLIGAGYSGGPTCFLTLVGAFFCHSRDCVTMYITLGGSSRMGASFV